MHSYWATTSYCNGNKKQQRSSASDAPQRDAPTYLFLTIALLFCSNTIATIIIDPAGDTAHPGRLLETHFEAGLTLQCAHAIQQRFTTAVITRAAGKNHLPFPDRQSFANRLSAEFYFSLSFYPDTQPTIALYYHCAHPVTDFWQFPYHPLAFVPFDQIHRRTIHQSATMARKAVTYLHDHCSVLVAQPIAIPIPELQGLSCPALKCEIGLTHADQWHDYVSLLEELINHLMESL